MGGGVKGIDNHWGRISNLEGVFHIDFDEFSFFGPPTSFFVVVLFIAFESSIIIQRNGEKLDRN